MRGVLVLSLAAGCGTGQDAFHGFDSGIPEDAGVWSPGEVLTCAHDPMPAYEDMPRWNLSDDFPDRVSIGAFWTVPKAATAVWSMPLGQEVLQGVGGGDSVAQAIRTSAAMGLVALQTVAYVDFDVVDTAVEEATVYCRMEDTDPPGHYYGLRFTADRANLVEDGEIVGEIAHDPFINGGGFRVVLSCQDRTSDTLVTAFLYERAGDTVERLGCVHHFDDSPRGEGAVGLGVKDGIAVFDSVRVYLP
jgi:hypothetical protein